MIDYIYERTHKLRIFERTKVRSKSTLTLLLLYSKKKDWNAMVRTNTIRKNPIGSTAEAANRRNRQSLRAHIIENVEAKTIDPEKLLGKYLFL